MHRTDIARSLYLNRSRVLATEFRDAAALQRWAEMSIAYTKETGKVHPQDYYRTLGLPSPVTR